MFTVANIVQELKNIGKIVAKRQSAGVALAMVNNVCIKLKKLNNPDAVQCLSLYEAVAESGLETELQTKLNQVIDVLATAQPQDEDEAIGGYGQKLDFPHAYLTQKDWDRIYDEKAGYYDILIVLSERMKKVGIKDTLMECSVKWWTCMLVNVAIDKVKIMPDYDAIYQLSKDVKGVLRSCAVKAHPSMPYLKVYPRSPRDLPADVFALAYPDPAEQPIDNKTLDKMPALNRDHTPVRESSKLLSKNRKKGEQGKPEKLDLKQLLKEVLQETAKPDEIPLTLFSPKAPAAEPRALTDAQAQPAQAHHAIPALCDDSQASEGSVVASSPRDSQNREATLVCPFKPKLRVAFQPSTPPAVAKAVPHDASAHKDGQTEDPGQKPAAAGDKPEATMTAEEFELAAFQALQAHKAKATTGGQAIDNTLKRPAAAQKQVPKKKPAVADGTQVQLGCKSCRGAQDGCGNCRNPNFKGWRGSHAEWLAFGLK